MQADTRNPRIAIVTGKLDRGGAEQHIVRIIPALKLAGVDVELFLFERGGVLEPELSGQDVVIHGLLREAGRVRHLIRSAYALFSYLRARRPDAIHFFLPQPYLIGSIVAIAARQRIRIMSRRSLNNYQRRHPFLAGLEHYLHRLTAALLGNSRAVVDQLVDESAAPGRIGLIYNGTNLPSLADADMRVSIRKELGVSDSGFVIVVVANLISYKGHLDLIDALAPIAKLLPARWRLIVIGRDDGEGAGLRSRVASSGLAEYIVWLGERNDVQRILSSADLFVLPSHQEGFSNALIEAMANGLPVIATAVGGNIDAVVDGESGRLVAMRSPEQIRAAILQLALDSDLRRSYGAAARRRVEQVFSLQVCVSRYENLYRGLNNLERNPVQFIIDGSAERSSDVMLHRE